MRNRMRLAAASIVVLVVAATSAAVQPSRAQNTAQAKADDCLARPGATTPKGSHWYYRRDRPSGKRCWYLGPANQKVVRQTAPAERNLESIPVPPPAPSELRPDEQARVETPAAVTTDTGSVTADAANVVAATQFSSAWPAAPATTHVNDRDINSNDRDATAAGGGGNVEQVATTEAQPEDMPLVWPALTLADRADAAPGLGHLAMFLAAAVAFVAIAFRAVFKLASAWRARGEPFPASRPVLRPAAPVIRPRAPERATAEPSFEAMAEPTIARLREIAKRWEQPTRVPRQPRLPAYEVESDYEVKAPPPPRRRVA